MLLRLVDWTILLRKVLRVRFDQLVVHVVFPLRVRRPVLLLVHGYLTWLEDFEIDDVAAEISAICVDLVDGIGLCEDARHLLRRL